MSDHLAGGHLVWPRQHAGSHVRDAGAVGADVGSLVVKEVVLKDQDAARRIRCDAQPMNLLARDGGSLGFRPENFLPKDMIDDGNGGISEFSFRVDRSEYLGSERIVYGAIEGFDTQVITAKLPPAHVAEESIRPGEWHAFGVKKNALRYFDRDGKRTSYH